MKTKYIHYGHTKFEPDRFKEIKNRFFFVKPSGGFWASPVDAKWGWKDWCEAEDFRECNIENSFKFTLKDTANVIHIHSVDDLEMLPKIGSNVTDQVLLDFEKLCNDGVDAIELHLSDDNELYWVLYGWDCDSILIMNPDIIETGGD